MCFTQTDECLLFVFVTETEFCSAVSLPHISDDARPQSNFIVLI